MGDFFSLTPVDTGWVQALLDAHGRGSNEDLRALLAAPPWFDPSAAGELARYARQPDDARFKIFAGVQADPETWATRAATELLTMPAEHVEEVAWRQLAVAAEPVWLSGGDLSMVLDDRPTTPVAVRHALVLMGARSKETWYPPEVVAEIADELALADPGTYDLHYFQMLREFYSTAKANGWGVRVV